MEKEPRKPFKNYAEEEAFKGLSYGFELIEKWKQKLKITIILRTGIMIGLTYLFYKNTNPWVKIGTLVVAFLLIAYWINGKRKRRTA